MKKLIALLLALVMVLGMVACGAKTDAPAADAPAADAPAADAPAAEAPAADENTSEVELTEASGDVTVIKYFCTIGAYSAPMLKILFLRTVNSLFFNIPSEIKESIFSFISLIFSELSTLTNFCPHVGQNSAFSNAVT